MRTTVKNLVLSIGLAVLLATPAMAWSDVGHKITGYIAWQRMTPNAKENVMRILRAAHEDSHIWVFFRNSGPESEEVRRRDYFTFLTTWADVIRDRNLERRYRNYHHSNWHYSDTFWRQVNGTVQVMPDPEDGGQGLKRLVEFDAVIRDAKASNADKAVAIAWIAHLTGDLHQPLHTSARVTDTEPKGDQGGNLVLLSPPDAKGDARLNLHWFWDSTIERNILFKPGMCESDYIEMAAQRIMKRHPFASMQETLDLGKYEDWVKQSFKYAPSVVFSPDLKRGEAPSPRYKANAFKLAQQQLAMAGYRLGETLNNVFGYPAPVKNDALPTR